MLMLLNSCPNRCCVVVCREPIIGETCHRGHYPTLFKEWQGICYVQCHTPQTIAFDNSVIVTLRERSGTRAAPGLDLTIC